MERLTKELRDQRLENGRAPDRDHPPVVKLFDPTGGATWLFSERKADGDTLFELCDLGMNFPERGTTSLEARAAVRGRFGLGLERNLYWESAVR